MSSLPSCVLHTTVREQRDRICCCKIPTQTLSTHVRLEGKKQGKVGQRSGTKLHPQIVLIIVLFKRHAIMGKTDDVKLQSILNFYYYLFASLVKFGLYYSEKFSVLWIAKGI